MNHGLEKTRWRVVAGLGLILGWIAAGLLYPGGMAGAETTKPVTPAAQTASAPAPAPVLPVVARPPATQPAIGLPADTHLDKPPPRQTKGLDLVRMGWTYNCTECHKLFPAKWHYDRPMAEHQDIQLQHGNNRFCLNCHHPTNRNAFVDYDGAEIAQADVVQLCAKCHGTIYRDWQAGVHGRENGFWNTNLGPQTKLRCIQCHDPHRPKFQPMKPLAPLRYPARAAHRPDHSPSLAPPEPPPGGGDGSSPSIPTRGRSSL
jgi:hypothetical protein